LLASESNWQQPEAVPTLVQMLQAENTPVRKLLVELLGQIKGRQASQALAMRATADLSPEVRERATVELKKRPAGEYTALLLEMLKYPFVPVADHAAETLTALNLKSTVPQLIQMLDEPDPAAYIRVKQGRTIVPVAREVVRINHLGNCVLCHAPSTDRTELVRGAVPTPGQPLPAPITTPQYYETGGTFVRADITYIRQDFSVMQPVDQPNGWPTFQRFDYIVRTRSLSLVQAETRRQMQRQPSPQRQALLFSLRELTGQDRGTRAEDWLTVLPPEQRPKLSSERKQP
jgi:HEAT repeats